MTKKATSVIALGIKCDHCKFNDPSVSADDYPEYVNKPCPDCGNVLLTQADFDLYRELVGLSDMVNEIFEGFDLEGQPQASFTIRSDGDGFIKEVGDLKIDLPKKMIH